MRFKIKYPATLWAFLFFFSKAFTQQTDFSVESLSYLPEVFYKTFDRDLPVYNGRLFSGYSSSIKGTAFFNDIQKETGTAVYDGVAYKNLRLMYDLNTDELIVRGDDNLPYILFSDRVSAFTFRDLTFIRIDNNIIPKGFYQVLEQGALTLLCKRQKIIKESIVGMSLEREFLVTDKFYILKDNVFYPITSRRTFYKTIREKKQLVAKALRSRNLRFKDDPEAFITTGIHIYNQQP
ncbi:MAG TPA: hypothetical protein PKE30_04840 [Niabella sp.]|nr:hypothetical protein [Niabella sp.]